MRLLFTGNLPVWLALTLALIGAVVIWRFYRRQSLPHPWRLVLPLVRLAALGLLLLALLQPVVSRHSKTIVRGRLAVVVDDSGSMSIADTYRPAEMVRTAWQLALFPRDERSIVVERARSQAADSQRRTTELAGEIDRALLPATSGQTSVPLRRGIHRLTQRAERMVRDTRNLRDSLAAALAETGYLSQVEAPLVKGRLLYERYDNIDGWQVSDLASAAHYPDRPDASAMLGRFAMPENVGERYGARVRAILSPPVSGEFVFWLAADDQAILWLSDGPAPANKREIARVPQWVPREVYDMYPEQRSEPIVLHKGERYYIEAVLKENLGDDHCTVGWTRPDGRREFPIPGVYFSPVDQTVERKRFDRAYRRVLADLAGEIEAWEGLTATVEGLPPPHDAAAEAATAREAMRQSFALRAAAWRRLVDDLAGLQKLADEALAAAGVESVDTALRKLAGMSRLEFARHLLLKGTLKIDKLEALGEVDIFLLDEPPQAISAAEFAARSLQATRDSTRLGSVIHGIVEHYADRPVAAILALTDGNINAGRSPSDVANYLSERDIRMLCVGVGRVEPPADVAIDQVIAPRTSFKGDRLTFTILLRRHGYAHRPIRISIASAGETRLTHTLPPGDDEIVSFELSFVEDRDGYQHYVVEAENMGGEALADNNRKAVSVNILTDPVRVLLLDQYPRWETRFVKLMLSRDPRVEAEVVFLGNAPFAERDGGLRPQLSRERLFALDILVLGDVPAHAFAPEELADIRRFVVERGGCLLLLAGPHHLPRTYRQSVLADILPVRVIPQTPIADETPPRPPTGERRLSLTESGGHSAAMQMAPTGSENERLWRELPPMNWLVEGVLPTPHAELLVVADDDRQAVALASHAGLGRVLFLGADSFWRWRYRAGWRFHQRLWNQIFLWATVGRTSGIDEHVKLIADRAEFSPGETVVLRARVLGRDKLPLEGGVVAATIVNEAGEPVKSVGFTHLPNSGGEYRAQVTDLPKGAYLAVPRVRELEGVPIKADYPFEIRDMPTSEYIDLALDEGTLARLGDHYWHFLEAEKALEHIPRIQLIETRRRDSEIWNTGWLLALLVALLGFEWQMRKKFNLP